MVIKPYYEEPGITIYHGDCRDILPHLEPVDLVLTDPIWPNCPVEYYPWHDFNPQQVFADTMMQLEGKRLVVVMRSDSDPRFLQGVPPRYPFFRTQSLPYVMPGYIGRKLGGDEIAYCFGEPIPSAPGYRVIPGIAPKAQPNGRTANSHPMSRPLVHFRWLVKWWSLPKDTILDPFVGSGTTLRAAKDLGRKAIGIEIEEKYCEIAVQRLKQEVLPLG